MHTLLSFLYVSIPILLPKPSWKANLLVFFSFGMISFCCQFRSRKVIAHRINSFRATNGSGQSSLLSLPRWFHPLVDPRLCPFREMIVKDRGDETTGQAYSRDPLFGWHWIRFELQASRKRQCFAKTLPPIRNTWLWKGRRAKKKEKE